MNYRSEVAAIKRLSKEIEQGEAAVEAAKWERAERIAALVDEGYTRAQVAEDVGVGAHAVSAWVRIWQAYGSVRANRRPRYADADYEVQGRGPGFGNSEPAIVAGASKLAHGNKVAIARKLLREPKVAEDVLREPTVREPIINALAQPTSAESAREPRPRDANVAALAQIARAHDQMEAANGTVEPDYITEVQRTKAEVMLRALESEIGVWRVNVGGEISDQAIARFMAGGV